ncbi:MAG: LCP family protein [Candidatus Wallbacteria bacterium]
MDNNNEKLNLNSNSVGSENISAGTGDNKNAGINSAGSAQSGDSKTELNKNFELGGISDSAGNLEKIELNILKQDTSERYRTKSQELFIIFIKFTGIFAVILVLAAFFVFGKKHVATKAYTVAKNVNKVVNIIPAKDKYVFLLLGTDKLIDVNRTDSMIMAYLSVVEKRVDIISIPRDMKVEIPGHGIQKINSVYTFEQVKTKSEASALKKVIEKIEEITGNKIDYHVKVDLDGFEKIVDLFGGVEIDVEKNMTYDDNKQNLHIRLKKGLQVLNGKKALEYCRFRHDRLGDIGRMQRQQKFLKALVNKLKDGKTIVRLPDIVSGAIRFVSTNIDMPLVMTLVAAIPEPSLIKIQTHTMPGDYGYVDKICYFVGEIDKLKELTKNILTGEIIKIEERKEKEKAEKENEKLKKELDEKNKSESRKDTKLKDDKSRHEAVKTKEAPANAIKPKEEKKPAGAETNKPKAETKKIPAAAESKKTAEKNTEKSKEKEKDKNKAKTNDKPQNVVIEVKPQEEPAATENLPAENKIAEPPKTENKIDSNEKKPAEVKPVMIKEDDER